VTRQFAVLLFAFFAIAAPAQAGLTVNTSTTQAGAGAQLTLRATFASTPSSVAVHFPPGLVGDPSGLKCTQTDFLANACATNTQVGTSVAHAVVLGLPIDAGGTVYNLVPNTGEPARLGIVNNAVGLFPVSHNQASVTLRPDGGLDSTIANLDNGGFTLTGLDLILDSDFITLPTSCAPATITLNTDSATFTPTGCANVPFNPGVNATLETTKRAAPTGATVTLTLPGGNSHVRRTDIVLPLGTTLNPGVADGLTACTR